MAQHFLRKEARTLNNCRKIREQLHDYVTAQADETLSLEIENHLQVCDECRRLYEAEKIYCGNLAHLSSHLTLPPETIKNAVVTRINEQNIRPADIKKRRMPIFSYGTAAAVVLVAALLLFSYRNGLTAQYMSDTSADFAVEDAADDLQNETAAPKLESAATGAADDVMLYSMKSAAPDSAAQAVQADDAPAQAIPDKNTTLDSAQNSPTSDASPTDTAESDMPDEFLDDAPLILRTSPMLMSMPLTSCGSSYESTDGAATTTAESGTTSTQEANVEQPPANDNTTDSNTLSGGNPADEGGTINVQEPIVEQPVANDSTTDSDALPSDSSHAESSTTTDQLHKVPMLITAKPPTGAIVDYGRFLVQNSLSPDSPQVVLNNAQDGARYSDEYPLPQPVIESGNFYALDITLDELKTRLKSCGITDYIVLSPDSPADSVYLFFNN